jgi:hypothetical protein
MSDLAALNKFNDFILRLSLDRFVVDSYNFVTRFQCPLSWCWCIVKDLNDIDTRTVWITAYNIYSINQSINHAVDQVKYWLVCKGFDWLIDWLITSNWYSHHIAVILSQIQLPRSDFNSPGNKQELISIFSGLLDSKKPWKCELNYMVSS